MRFLYRNSRVFYHSRRSFGPLLRIGCLASYPESMTEAERHERLRVGLCVHCRHVRQIVSERGSRFYLCQRSAHDPTFPKYPRLPVHSCRGYEDSQAYPPEHKS